MPYETDQRLKTFLDTNQLHREQLCLAVLATDSRYSNVRPRHPRGGPDGGRDIEATFQSELRTFGAVAFLNHANDSAEQKTRLREKFRNDLNRALAEESALEAFAFFTNLNLTVGEKDTLIQVARGRGLKHCEIFDRERLRIALDSPDGFAARFQYLQIPLSEAEQASFFARWGDDIQSVIATGFQRLEAQLDRMLFLEEARDPLSYLTIVAKLDRRYEADEIGHFRLFCDLGLKEQRDGVIGLLFGISDKAGRIGHEPARVAEIPAGIAQGISGGQWEWRLCDQDDDHSATEHDSFVLTSSLRSVGINSADALAFSYLDDPLMRFKPALTLRDLDRSQFILVANRCLAERISGIHVYSGGYRVLSGQSGKITVDDSEFPAFIPVEFSEEELSDPWVRIRPSSLGSAFFIDFSDSTPKRLAAPRALEDDHASSSRT